MSKKISPEEIEKLAMRGEEMPSGLDYPQQILYLSFALLYARYREKHISREDAKKQKLEILDAHAAHEQNWKMADEWNENIRLTELARAAFRKEPSVENGWKLVHIIEGRKT